MSYFAPFVEPSLTFGVELEMLYIANKADILSALEIPREHDQIALEDINQDQFEAYIVAILDHRIPASSQLTPSTLGQVQAAGIELAKYNVWTVTRDDSIGGGEREIERLFHIPLHVVVTHNEWRGIELISPVFLIRAGNWLVQLRQIERDFGPRNYIGAAYNNHSTGLHVHIAHENQAEIPLRVLQNLILSWAVCEELIETMHPMERRGKMNKYACSLRRYKQALAHIPGYEVYQNEDLDVSWRRFAERIYATMYDSDIRNIVGPYSGKKFVKVHISMGNPNKKQTVEFREHRGTQDAEEIRWWIRFCERMVVFAFKLTHFQYRFFQTSEDTPQYMGDLESLFMIIGLEEEGRQFFRAKVAEYQREAEARAAESPYSYSGNSGSSYGSSLFT